MRGIISVTLAISLVWNLHMLSGTPVFHHWIADLQAELADVRNQTQDKEHMIEEHGIIIDSLQEILADAENEMEEKYNMIEALEEVEAR